MSENIFKVRVSPVVAPDGDLRAYITEEEARKAVAFFDVKTPKPGQHFRHPSYPGIFVRLYPSIEYALRESWYGKAKEEYGVGVNIRSGLVCLFTSFSEATIITPYIKESHADIQT